jgi:menaquinol-cytochrome c reductase iron-sulfur subunit
MDAGTRARAPSERSVTLAVDMVRAVAERRREPKPKYTSDRNIPGAFEGETVTRRRFMTLSAHGAGAVAASAFTLPALGFAVGSAVFERPSVRWESVGKPADFPNDTYVPKVVTTVTGIGEVGKTTIYMRARNDAIDGPPNPPGYNEQFVAVTTRCMHLGCPVRYVQASQRFICPCHGGVYDFRGSVVGGPPVRPLDRFYTRVRNGNVEVGPRYSVNSEFRRFPSYRDPAQDLDGIGQYLYPGRFSTPKQ